MFGELLPLGYTKGPDGISLVIIKKKYSNDQSFKTPYITYVYYNVGYIQLRDYD